MSKNKHTILNLKPTGSEISTEGVRGNYAAVTNWGAETAYVSCNAGVTAGADGVMPVPSGCSALIAHNGTLYILGNGDVTVIGSDEPVNFIKPVVGGDHSDGTAISNTNLLVNPDLSINQRALTEYGPNRNTYTVDCWKLHATNGTAFNAADKAIAIPESDTGWYGIVQAVETDLAGKTVTLSADVQTDFALYMRIVYGTSINADFTQVIPAGYSGIIAMTATIPTTATAFGVQFTNRCESTTGGTMKLNWAKLELGSKATAFVPPQPATELLKCQRYYQVHSSGDISEIDLRPSMRTTPTITQLENGNYSYSADM